MTWVDERIYAGGGAHIPATWGAFARQTGISAVLHLNPARPEPFLGPPPQAFLWLDLADESQAGLDERWLAGRFLAAGIESGLRVLIHSGLGRHRVRWAYVAYRICVGRPVAAALRQAAQKPWLSPYRTDAAAWEAFARWARERRRAGSAG